MRGDLSDAAAVHWSLADPEEQSMDDLAICHDGDGIPGVVGVGAFDGHGVLQVSSVNVPPLPWRNAIGRI